MSNNPRQRKGFVTKKHLARLERERMQSRYLLIGTVVTALIVVLLVGYGVLNETVLRRLQPVATVNGDRISTGEFQELVRYQRLNIINNAVSLYNFARNFGDSPETQVQLAAQLSQAQSSLQAVALGQDVLNQAIEDRLIRQEAARRGITVSKEEVDKALEEAFGYFPNGTPTAEPTFVIQPTSTLSAQQMTLVPPSPTPTATDVPTVTATLAPTATATLIPTITPTSAATATPTEYTSAAFDENYQEAVKRLGEEIDFNKSALRRLFESNLYREKVQEAVLADLNLKAEAEQVWARHILAPDEAAAKLVLDQVNAGGDWYSLAAQYSDDPGSKQSGGDLGWFGRKRMVPEFENAAFSLQVGEVVSQPVKSSFGFHIIQVLGRENRPLSEGEFDQLRQEKFAEWLKNARDISEVEIRDYWLERTPEEPPFPVEIQQFISTVQQQQQLQQQSLPTIEP
jgi:parvulin-like peptidyl-prolyl isomerase